MSPELLVSGTIVNSRLSLQPLAAVLQQMIAENKPGARKLYEPFLKTLDHNSELLKGVDDAAILRRESEILEMLLATVFPPSNFETESMHALLYPFSVQSVYASPAFKDRFIGPDGFTLRIPDEAVAEKINQSRLNLAYNLLLRRCYDQKTPYSIAIVHQVKNEETGLPAYMEFKINGQYIDVRCPKEKPELPEEIPSFNSLSFEEKNELIPINSFAFEGISIVSVEDVTERELISEIKNTLLGMSDFSDESIYSSVEQHIRSLAGLPGLKIGITPFFRKNDYYLFPDSHTTNSLLFRRAKTDETRNWAGEYCQEFFEGTIQPVVIDDLGTETSKDDFLEFYRAQGLRSLAIFPLKNDHILIGILEVGAKEPGMIKSGNVSKIESAIPLFSVALRKSMENLEMQIDRKIKESFTAVQSAVEWKFTEAAFNYLQAKRLNENAKIPPITFQDVYPLYAAIDIRSSSEERNKAILLDLEEQLNLAKELVTDARATIQFPLLKEISYKIDKYLERQDGDKLSEDEMVIHDFLQQDVYSVFSNLEKNTPEIRELTTKYMKALDPQRRMIYRHRKEYEDTITIINDTLEKFIENEQESAQKVFPHYFEHYVTDGVEFNIYIGQSMAPQHRFDEIYVKNLKMWQLNVLSKAAKLTHAMEKRLPLPLQTTQLILSHSTPISISFRSKERKFDVDGAYNMRYEIIKKRIDKVHIRDQKERLTQPGTISIVYSSQKEKTEYLEYIDVLCNEGLLRNEVEELELEELSGVSSLFAIRVPVNLPADGS